MRTKNLAPIMLAFGFIIGLVSSVKPSQQHRPEIDLALNAPVKAPVTKECKDIVLKWNEALSNSMNAIAYMRQTNIDMVKRYIGWKETRDQIGADSHDLGCPLV